MGIRGWVKKLERVARGETTAIVQADGTRFWYNPESPEAFMHCIACLEAQSRGEPFPEPPPVFKAIAGARDRRAALDAVWDGGDLSDIWPYDIDALLDRGELQPVSMVEGRELGEPLPDLSEGT